jgi:hypothetical protein
LQHFFGRRNGRAFAFPHMYLLGRPRISPTAHPPLLKFPVYPHRSGTPSPLPPAPSPKGRWHSFFGLTFLVGPFLFVSPLGLWESGYLLAPTDWSLTGRMHPGGPPPAVSWRSRPDRVTAAGASRVRQRPVSDHSEWCFEGIHFPSGPTRSKQRIRTPGYPLQAGPVTFAPFYSTNQVRPSGVWPGFFGKVKRQYGRLRLPCWDFYNEGVKNRRSLAG